MESYSEAWNLVKEYCKGQVTETIYTLWLDPIELVNFEGTKVTLLTSEFKANIVKSKFIDLLNRAFEETMGFPVEIEFVTENIPKNGGPEKNANLTEESPNNYELSFENFIVGSSNKFAYAAAQAVAANPGKAYNPLFIYGNSGLGKTHLLNAICIEIKKNNPTAKIICTRGEDFANELIDYIRNGKNMTEFHNKYRTSDVLLIDDIQFIGGKTQTQEEFFHTFEALWSNNKQIVLISDRPPKEIQLLEDRLKGRFEWGLLADIQSPDLETRIAIIMRKADFLGLSLPADVVQYIAEKIKSNVRQLESVVRKIDAHCKINGTSPSIAIAEKAIKEILADNQPIPLTIEKILNEVSRNFNILVENILSNKRNAEVVEARRVAIYVIREITSLSTEKIGEEFNMNHSTVIYNIKKCEEEMKTNSALNLTIKSIIDNVKDNTSTF